MDHEQLRARLARAELRLGRVEETLHDFIEERPAPVAFVSFDMDYYSSTRAALALLRAEPAVLLPRIQCFFDDLFICGDFEGERRAIAEFNAASEHRKLSRIRGLEYLVPREVANRMYWQKYFMACIFDHPRFAEREHRLRDTRELGLN